MTPSESALQYALDVTAGEIVACRYVKLACQRFLDDLEKQDTDWPYCYDAEEADFKVGFMESLPHLKGPSAGKPFVMEPFQRFAECNIFGWRHKETGRRRFTNIYEEQARKNGKSMRVAARGMAVFCLESASDQGMECVSGATSEKQAWYLYWYVHEWPKKVKGLRDRYGIEVNAKSLLIPESGAKFEPIIGKPGDGGNWGFAVCDEYHEHPDDTMYECADTGQGARAEPLLCVITTAGFNLTSPCYARRREVIQILEGSIDDDSVFGIIYTIDEGVDWADPKALYMANPNIGVSVSDEWLLRKQEQAKRSASKATSFRTKHLCEWVGARSGLFNMVNWHRQRTELTLADFKHEECHIGLDLASKKDIAAAVITFKRGDEYYSFPRFWAPESAADDNKDYKAFAQAGYLTLTPGNMIDFAYIESEILQVAKNHRVLSVAFDPFQSTYLITRLSSVGVKCVEYPNTVKNMSEPLKQIDALIDSGKYWHEKNRCMDWQASCVEVRVDAKDNIFPRKTEDGTSKIDGPVAATFAMGRWLLEPVNQQSYLERRDVVRF